MSALIKAEIPPIFRNLTAKIRGSFRLGEKGLCLTGPPGVGKTMTLCLLARDWYRGFAESESDLLGFPNTWKFISYPTLIMNLQDSWWKMKFQEPGMIAEPPLEQLKKTAKVDHLIIDDLGAEKLTDFVRQATYFIINDREQHQRKTYITTNFSFNQLDIQYDVRISSRIAGMCEVIEMTGKDLRLR